MTTNPSGYAPAHINPEAVFWLNAPESVREALRRAGAAIPAITEDDRYAAAQAKAQADQGAPKPQP
ncbi:MAG: hypothetical protein HYS17_00945 [Micavibrio aeruginosavorus]|uniref:Uncharacterized protein n=1 Tax=Micavibrio aeruginosavorus TaxID=349221 RepID=A0A7T5R2R2_9BACT|nr:MAG: hypothetical protein HYS17_00945 [Micavibrio aeruginosavorus]